MAKQEAITDNNNVPALTIHSGTADTADTIRLTGQTSGAVNAHMTGGTVTTLGSGGTDVNIVSGTQQTLGTVGVVNNLVTGTLAAVTSVTNLVSGTLLNSGTTTGVGVVSDVTTGSLGNIAFIHEIGTMPAISVGESTGGTLDLITSVANLAGGTVNMLHAGTIDTIGALPNVTLNDIQGGTIDLITALTTVTSVTNLAAGTVQLDGVPTDNILLFGTIGTAGAAAPGTLVTAGGVGTSHYMNELSMIVESGTVDAMIAYGTAIVGAAVLARGKFIPSAGIQKSFPKSPGGANANEALTWALQGAGTVSFNISYFTK